MVRIKIFKWILNTVWLNSLCKKVNQTFEMKIKEIIIIEGSL